MTSEGEDADIKLSISTCCSVGSPLVWIVNPFKKLRLPCDSCTALSYGRHWRLVWGNIDKKIGAGPPIADIR